MKRNFNLQKMHILCAEAIKLRKARLCFCCAETAIYHLQAMQEKKEEKKNLHKIEWGSGKIYQ